jgi:hypothetical protein
VSVSRVFHRNWGKPRHRLSLVRRVWSLTNFTAIHSIQDPVFDLRRRSPGVGDGSPGSCDAEGEGGEGFYIGRCADLLWGGRVTISVALIRTPARTSARAAPCFRSCSWSCRGRRSGPRRTLNTPLAMPPFLISDLFVVMIITIKVIQSPRAFESLSRYSFLCHKQVHAQYHNLGSASSSPSRATTSLRRSPSTRTCT